jgi:hypothetical protein
MQRKISSSRKNMSPAFITLIIIGCTVAFVSLLYVFRQSLTSRESSVVEVKSNNPALEAQVSKLASEFMCTCGNCSNETLDQCICENAQKARQIIRTSLLAGRPMVQIVATIDSSFGGRIEKQTGEIKVDEILPAAQRTEVLSHFRCPCGKCGMENLAECECDHPRGGREVRGFLDRKLSEKQYSSIQLIAEIEKVYGKKRF